MSDDLANGATNRGPTYRVPRSGMDPATKRLALIAAGLGGALFVVVGAWSTIGGHSDTVPVIAAPSTPLRVKPENPGGMKVANNGLILAGKSADSGTDTLAPAPEVPDPQALKARHDAPRAVPASAPAAPKAVAAAQPAPATVTPPVRQETAKAETPKPAAAPAASSSGHGAQVQLAALSTREAAEEEWRRLSHRDAGLLAGRSPTITESTVNGRTWWRLRTGGFADEAQAKEFCEKFRTGGAACTVARF